MKDAYYPGWWDIHNGRLSRTGTDYNLKKSLFYANGRALYGDWGRLGNVAVNEGLQSCNQFTIENNLSYKLEPFYYLKQEELLNDENSHFFPTKRKELISAYSYFRNNIEHCSSALKRKHKNDMNCFIEAVENEKSIKTLQKKTVFTPPCLQYLVNKRSDLLFNETAEQGITLSSPIYTGGCIKTINFNQDTYVIYCDGINMTKLTIDKINTEINSLEKSNIYQYEIKEERIYQIDVIEFVDYFIILIRFLNSIETFKVFQKEEKFLIERMSTNNSMDQFISCKFDSKWPRQYAATFSDKIYIYDTKSEENVWCKDITNYSSVIDQWNEIQSTNISKTWMLTNRSNSYFYDARINPFSSGVELFNNRVDSLSGNESFYHATNIFNSNNYYIFSTFNAILIDIRSPLIAVSQWTVPSMNPVSYSSVNSLQNANELGITVGYQMNAKHSIFQQNIKNNSKSTALVSKSHVSYDTIMSLGIATVFNEQSNVLSVLTLDNKRNVLGNQYQLNDGNYDCHSKLSKPIAKPYRSKITNKYKKSIQTNESLIDVTKLAPYKISTDLSVKKEIKHNCNEFLFRAMGMYNDKKEESLN